MEIYENSESKPDESTVDNKATEQNTVNVENEEEVENDVQVENKEESEAASSEENNETSENNGFQIVEGDGSEIEISSVHEHLNSMKPKTQEEKTKRPIVIPEIKPLNNQENDDNV